jgi:hypothetical protein
MSDWVKTGDYGPWVNSISGRPFYLTQPERSQVQIEDIAYGLSNLCRFAGQTREFYSVAQHSVMVADLMQTNKTALQGLLHDAAEAYTGDFTSPMKSLMDGYKTRIEEPIEREIFRQLDVPFPMSPEVKVADTKVLATEIRDLMNGTLWQEGLPEPLVRKIWAWPPAVARHLFLKKYHALKAASGLD